MEHSVAFMILWCLCQQRNAIIFIDNRTIEKDSFFEIKETYHLWSLGGGEVLKRLLVAKLPSI
jgi:hypothetical protein